MHQIMLINDLTSSSSSFLGDLGGLAVIPFPDDKRPRG